MEAAQNKLGWIVAAVLAVVLGGVLIFQSAGGDDSREAAIGDLLSAEVKAPPGSEATAKEIAARKQGTKIDGFGALPADMPVNEVPLDLPPPTDCDVSAPPNVWAEWRHTPARLADAQALADEIVVATVTSVAPGDPYVTESPGGEVSSLPTQNVTLAVDDRLKGGGSGGEVTLWSLGDGATGCWRVAGDPMYEKGQQYLLMLEPGGGDRPLQAIGPGGRWLVVDGLLQAVNVDHQNMQDVAKQPLAVVTQLLRAKG